MVKDPRSILLCIDNLCFALSYFVTFRLLQTRYKVSHVGNIFATCLFTLLYVFLLLIFGGISLFAPPPVAKRLRETCLAIRLSIKRCDDDVRHMQFVVQFARNFILLPALGILPLIISVVGRKK